MAGTSIVLRHADPFPREVIEAAKAHAAEVYPQESCGLVLEGAEGFVYVPCTNVHPTPDKAFRVHPNETASAMQRGAIHALIHSHPEGPNYPSFSDQQCQIESGLTWGIIPVIGVNEGEAVVPVPSEVVWWGDDLPTPSLHNRQFIWGIFHCYALYRDWMRTERGILIPNFACDADFIAQGHNIFVDNCERAGLRNLGKIDMSCLQVGDMLVGHVRGEFPNHCGVYLGGDDFLHHLTGMPSGPANLLRWWPRIDTVMRYNAAEGPSVREAG